MLLLTCEIQYSFDLGSGLRGKISSPETLEPGREYTIYFDRLVQSQRVYQVFGE